MGLHGSSTTAVILQDVKVPAENLLGEIGKGHKIAFNVLNFARLKLGAMCAGAARGAIGEAARYAGSRKQFGQPIASFGAIKHKLGEMAARTYAIESLIYRTAGMIDARIEATPPDPAGPPIALTTLEEYAIEASIAKVAGSEMLKPADGPRRPWLWGRLPCSLARQSAAVVVVEQKVVTSARKIAASRGRASGKGVPRQSLGTRDSKCGRRDALRIRLHRRIVGDVDPDVDVRVAAEVPDERRAFQPPVVPDAVVADVAVLCRRPASTCRGRPGLSRQASDFVAVALAVRLDQLLQHLLAPAPSGRSTAR